MEHTATGHLMQREANHHPHACPQGVYPCADGPAHCLVGGDRAALAGAAGCRTRTELDQVSASDELADRYAARHRFDELIEPWCASLAAADIVERLLTYGVPAAQLEISRGGDRNPQVNARGFYEAVEHPLAGTHRFPAMPVRFGRQPDRWFCRPAPMLGEHNAEVLGGLLGIEDDELAQLAAAQIIGTRPAFAPASPAV